ncbi:hypothetical protein ABT56_12955 [Photobacterium aquae]|uniref:Uncharacterized protein n=1 Tax=Photobacterium aquae TaxID=1195763 RepID=A0A0J1GZT6_9GAMM|nr:hypothetical protein ABT56_12955 [Photobacterium aquae]
MAHLASFNKQDIEQYLADIPALKNYKLNSATGSIVIEYDAAMINPAVIEALFSDSDSDAEQACMVLGRCIDVNGVL